MISNDTIAQAADWLRHADGLLIAAGAGMGVDSGLPDFRGADGFWRVSRAQARTAVVSRHGKSGEFRLAAITRVGLLRPSALAISRHRTA